ncbi:MAG: hypothetical protein ACFFDN_17515 [Candidatus Hodarchaeota archaeon]
MIIEMEVELADKPGQLMMVIEPISKRGGNFLGIYHLRDRVKASNIVPVVFNFEVENLNQLNQIKNDLLEADLNIIRIESEVGLYYCTIILIGHVYATDIKDTIDSILNLGVLVRKVDSRIVRPEEVSSVKISIQVDSKDKFEKVYKLINEICEKKNLFAITELL